MLRQAEHLNGEYVDHILFSLLREDFTPLGSGVFLGMCQLPGAMPGQELVNVVDGVIGDVG